MRKLDLTNYTVKMRVPAGDPYAPMIDVEYPYYVKDAILTYMFVPALRLTGLELAKQNVVALKIEACDEDFIELEEDEFARVKSAFDLFEGFGRPDLELVNRIRDTKQEDSEN